ncbi:hypothetical protein ACS0TY_021430 [Phlomoides rotata]
MKRYEIKKMIRDNGIEMCCIQETKLEKIENWIGNELWMLVVKGRWLEDGSDIILINVYAPCTTGEKEQLWDTLKIVIE